MRKPAIPVTMVCGPPAAGKSTYVRDHAGPNDLVIDFDRILESVTGSGASEKQRRAGLSEAALERNRILRTLSTDRKHERCWFIICAGKEETRLRWAKRLDAEVVLLDTPRDVCLARVRSEKTSRETKASRLGAVRRWWTQHAGRGKTSERGYGWRWQKARAAYIERHPLCAECGRQGRTAPAKIVDHITPHKGDQSLFWDEGNWQPLCRRCHDSIKRSEERGGEPAGVNAAGVPLDPRHPWNVGRGGV